MKTHLHIPIKGRSSERIPDKNFVYLDGKPLCHHLLDRLVANPLPDTEVWIDTEEISVWDQLTLDQRRAFRRHDRAPALAEDWANGNHMLAAFALAHPGADIYAQAFVTAPFLRAETIGHALAELASPDHDSVLTVTEECGFLWVSDAGRWRPMNYDTRRMDGLPRSQDNIHLMETTGFYAVKATTLRETGCRVGRNPIFVTVAREEALDINTLDDLRAAEARLKS